MMQAIHKGAPGALILTLAVSGLAGAQVQATATGSPATTSSKVTTRQLGAATATSAEMLGSVAAVRQLPNGNVLVNDQVRRRVIMLDKDMKLVSVVADSTSNTGNAYGVRPGGLMAYRGDSTLFIDPASLSMLVLDQDGKIVRTMAAPRPNDVNFLIGGPMGNPGFDAKGRLVYRTMDFGFRGGRGGGGPQPGVPFTPPTPPDSSALVRFDLATRKLDTVGFYKIPKTNISVTQTPTGGMSMTMTINPLPVVDDWTVMSDGSIAFVRGQDYHVDFIDADGNKTSADKVPYEWQRLTDDDKTRFLDSAKVAIETARAANQAAGGGGGGRGGGAAGGIEALMGGGGGQPMVITMSREMGPGGGGAAPPPRVDVRAGGPAGTPSGPPPINMVSASELPDYKPVFGTGSVRADLDGRIWVRTIPTKPTPGGAIYDVLDRSGKLVDRVQVPAGTTIAGFGKGGIVYLGVRDTTGLHIQRIPLK